MNRLINISGLYLTLWSCFFVGCFCGQAHAAEVVRSFAEVNHSVQQRSVKIYGAGGLRQFEAYQSGLLVSAKGHIATALSLVLVQDEAVVVLSDGRRFTGKVVGVDSGADVALLKIDVDEESLPFFDLTKEPKVQEGMQVLAFSNLYNVATGDEPVSVLHGCLSAIAPLKARRGAFSTRFHGDVYVLDAATNNPGAAGGVLVDRAGNPLGMLGKELRSEVTGTWLNYALPLPQVASSVALIRSGKGGLSSTNSQDEQPLPEHPVTFQSLGLLLVPEIVPRTPPFVDRVVVGSPAAKAKIRPDDLLLGVGGQVTGTRREVEQAIRQLPIDQPISLTLLRDNQLLEIQLTPAESTP